MHGLRLGRAVLFAVVAGCGPSGTRGPSGTSEADRYVGDRDFRRAQLVASLVNPTNAYSMQRLAHYAGGDGAWDALPEWNPRVEPVLASEVDQGTALRSAVSTNAAALDADAPVDDEQAMLALGRAAFFAYPTQLATYASVAIGSRAAVESYGLSIDEAGGQVGGLVRVEMPDGSAALALTCASCHSASGATGLVVGVGSATLDLGKMIADAGDPDAPDPTLLAWGRGRVDVTTADGTAPERIPDLRPVRWLTHLHQEATVAQGGRTVLAIRIETLIVTRQSEALRPPRAVAWALATYLDSLADGLPSAAPASPEEAQGARVFATRCVHCHTEPGLTGFPVPLAVVGTDPAIGMSPERGTGMYRVPSLHGVGSRGLLLHDASLPSVDAMFDPARVQGAFAGGTRGPGAVPGHVFGLDLGDADRQALLTFLRAL